MNEAKIALGESEVDGGTWEGAPFRVRFSPYGYDADIEILLSTPMGPVRTKAIITARFLADGGLWWMLERMLRHAVEYARATPPPAEIEDLALVSSETVYHSIDDAIAGLNEGIEEMERMIAERGKG